MEAKRQKVTTAPVAPTLTPTPMTAMALCAALSDREVLKTAIEFMKTDPDVRALLRDMNVVCRPENDLCKLLDRIEKLRNRASGSSAYNPSSEAGKLAEIQEIKSAFDAVGMNIPRTTKKKLFEGATVSANHWSFDRTRRYGTRNGYFHIPEEEYHEPDGKDTPFHTYQGGKNACDFGMRVCEALGVDTDNDVRSIPEGHTFCVNWRMTAGDERNAESDDYY